MDDHRRLAALAVFRELYNSQKNLYDILREFVVEIISSRRLFSFSPSVITAELETEFGVRVPEAVVKSVLRSLTKKVDWCWKEDGGDYAVSSVPKGVTSDIESKYAQKQAANRDIFNRLVVYINDRQEKPLTGDEEKIVINSFCAFLLNEKNGEAYSKYISSFVLDHEDDERFQRDLNEIREGVILYSGITYNDKLAELGTWKTEMTLFLDQEILFHCAGLNGELFKSYFVDFHDLVKEVNNSSKKKLIHLRYFPDTKDEIDSFFSYAEMVVRNYKPIKPGNTAMKSIVNGCQSASDVSEKRTRFYRLLEGLGIGLEGDFVFDESKYPHNILSEEVYKSVLMDLWGLEPQGLAAQGVEITTDELQDKEYRENRIRDKVASAMALLNKIHCMRGSARSDSFYTVGYYFLTGTDVTLRTAWHDDIKGSETVPLATSLDWVTTKLWFKLNKGFEGDALPSSFKVLSKARIVLSTAVNRSVGESYDRLLIKYRKGELTKELVKASIVDLMEKTVSPEEIDTQSIDQTLDFLQKDSIEHYKAEQEAERQRQEEQLKENEQLRNDLEQVRQEKGKLKAVLERQENERILGRINGEIAKQESGKLKADDWCSRICCSCLGMFALLVVAVVWGVYMYFTPQQWDYLEPKVAAVQVAMWFISLFLIYLFRKPLTHEGARKRLERYVEKRVYSRFGVSELRLKELMQKRDDLKSELE